MDIPKEPRTSWAGRALIALLTLTLIAFIVGHLASRGALWNHASGETFSPWRNYISDYAYRSPVWPLFIACMYALGASLGILSWQLFRLRPGRPAVIWLMSALLAYAGLKFVEVAIFPVKAPEVSIDEIQSRMDQGTWSRLKEELGATWHGKQAQHTSAWEAVNAFGNNRGHLIGIRGAIPAVLTAMILGISLQLPATHRWRIISCITVALVVFGISRSSPPWHGLYQRLAFIGIYLWIWAMTLSLFRDPGKRDE